MRARIVDFKQAWSLALAIAAYIAAGCGGGSSASFPGPGPAASAAPLTAPVTFSIVVGSAGSSAYVRRPRYLSTQTQSVAITPVVLGSPNQPMTVVNIAANALGCTGTGAALTCQATVTAPVGQTSFNVTTYAAQNAGGAVLSAGSITLDVQSPSSTQSISNRASLTLNAVAASFKLHVAPAALTFGVPSTVDASVTSYDATGAIIIGPGALTTPIDLETIAPSGTNAVLQGPTPVNPPPGCTYPVGPDQSCFSITDLTLTDQSAQLTYKGQFVNASSILLVAESPGIQSQAVSMTLGFPPTPAPTASPSPGTTPSPNPSGSSVPTASPSPSGCVGTPIVVCPGLIIFANPLATPVPMVVFEAGVTTFTADARVCDIADRIAAVNFGSQASGDSFTIEPLTTPGNCAITFSDASNNQTLVNVTLLQGLPSPTPSPSPSPTITPTPLPTGPITIKPSNTLEFPSSTAPPIQITASEPGYSSFTIDQTLCSGVATVDPTMGTVFNVTPVAALTQGGTCTFTVSNGSGQQSSVLVYVDGIIFRIH